MGFLESLILVAGNAAVPGLGLLASIVTAISSDNRNAGGRFLFDLATSTLPLNFWGDLAAGVVGDLIFESSASSAAQFITPANNVAAPCEECGNYTTRYVLRKGRILCSDCLSSDISGIMKSDYNLYVYRKKVSVLHGKFITANNIPSYKLEGTHLKGRRI